MRPTGLASACRSKGPYSFPVSRFDIGVSSRVQGRYSVDYVEEAASGGLW